MLDEPEREVRATGETGGEAMKRKRVVIHRWVRMWKVTKKGREAAKQREKERKKLEAAARRAERKS